MAYDGRRKTHIEGGTDLSNHRLGADGRLYGLRGHRIVCGIHAAPGRTLPLMLSCGASIFIAFGYICLAAGWQHIAEPEKRACAFTAVAFAAVYAVYVTLVYYTN
jgi:hypothetical protein